MNNFNELLDEFEQAVLALAREPRGILTDSDEYTARADDVSLARSDLRRCVLELIDDAKVGVQS